MGFLEAGTPISWFESLVHHASIKKDGIIQLINIINTFKNRRDDEFLWGDEVENLIVHLDHNNRTARLTLNAHDILKRIEENKKKHHMDGAFLPEYGNHMIETTPSAPYGGYTSDLVAVEQNMRKRRSELNALLHAGEKIITMVNFPLLGSPSFSSPYFPPTPLGVVSRSLYLSDALINPHPRFATLTANIRLRRGEKVDIRVPLLKDVNTEKAMQKEAQMWREQAEKQYLEASSTPSTSSPPSSSSSSSSSSIPSSSSSSSPSRSSFLPANISSLLDTIHMDAMGFGMGMCCLQVTFQARGLDESRRLYDHLAVLAPVMLALTAATPFYNGKIADIDARWTVISQSVDDRSAVERGVEGEEDGTGPFTIFSPTFQTPAPQPSVAVLGTPHFSPCYSGPSSSSSASSSSSSSSSDSSASSAAASTYDDCAVPPEPLSLGYSMDTADSISPSSSSISLSSADAATSSSTTKSSTPTSTPTPPSTSTTSVHRPPHLPSACSKQKACCAHLFDGCDGDSGLYSVRRSKRLLKSRYDSISTYISHDKDFKHIYNDLELEIDRTTYDTLLENGVDELLARHIGHLYVRDPLVIYSEAINLDNASNSAHFENIQSTNWQTVRFKPPSPQGSTGWRVEFRSMEVQLTDFENAAFTVFIALVSRAMLFFDLNFYIPLSRVDENMKIAHRNNAVINDKFYWRKHHKRCPGDSSISDPDAYELMSMREIMLGKAPHHPGLIAIVHLYLDLIKCDAASREQVNKYLTLIARRAAGTLLTAAQWMRKYVSKHPSYGHDSLLNSDIVFDLVQSVDFIANGTLEAPQLLGDLCNTQTQTQEQTQEQTQTQARTQNNENYDRGAKLQGGVILNLEETYCCENVRSRLNVIAQGQWSEQSKLELPKQNTQPQSTTSTPTKNS